MSPETALQNIETALGQHLLTMPACPPVVWDDQDVLPERPYVRFAHVPVQVMDDTLAGTEPRWQGQVLLTVTTPKGKLAQDARRIAGKLCLHFPKTLRLPVPDGIVLIHRPPEPRSGFPDGSDWRLPVVIHYKTENQS